jgi:cytochrome P450
VSTREFQEDPLKYCTELARDYGPVVRFYMGPYQWYMLTNPEDIYDALVKRWEVFHKPKLNKRIFHFFLGESLLSADGEYWKYLHKMVQPAFHRQRIEAYSEFMVEAADRIISHWKPGEEIDFAAEMTDLTLIVVGKTLFDADVSEEADRIRDAMNVVNTVLVDHINMPLPVPKWWPSKKNRAKHSAIAEIESVVSKLVADRRRDGVDRGDLLSTLVFTRDENGRALTDKELRDAAMTLIFAGHDTTSHALTWMWYLLARHPECLKKLQDEVDGVLRGKTPTAADLKNLPYLEMVMKEALRLLPSVWCFMREPTEDVQVGDYVIPKGSQVFISPFVVQRQEALFDNPTEFRPERFTRENERRIPRGAYIPFSIGPRVCQGKQFALMEASLILARLVQKFEPTLVPGFEPELYPKLTMSSKNGMRTIVTPREVAK